MNEQLRLENGDASGTTATVWTFDHEDDGSLDMYRIPNGGSKTQTMTFKEDGNISFNNNVGIGCAPAYPLHVLVSGDANPIIYGESSGVCKIKVKTTAGGGSGGAVGYFMENADDDQWFMGIQDPDGGLYFIDNSAGQSSRRPLCIKKAGGVGIETTNPGQLLDCNAGSGNMIADGYDTHSLAVYKENIEDASGYLDKVLACPAQKWNPKPFVSAEEIKKAVLDEFGEDVVIEEAVEAQDAVYEDAEVTPAVEAADAVMGERAVTETIETGSYVNLAGETITETEERNVTEEVTETVVERQTGEDGITREVEVERTVQRNVMEAYEIKPAIEAVDAVIEQRLVSEAIEAKDAVYEKQYSVWDELFPEDNSHRQKALYNMPEGDLKTWIDDWCEAKRVEMRPEDKWQKKRLGLVADAELTAEHLPEVISINDDGEPTGIDTMTYIGILHNAVQELSTKVTTLENA